MGNSTGGVDSTRNSTSSQPEVPVDEKTVDIQTGKKSRKLKAPSLKGAGRVAKSIAKGVANAPRAVLKRAIGAANAGASHLALKGNIRITRAAIEQGRLPTGTEEFEQLDHLLKGLEKNLSKLSEKQAKSFSDKLSDLLKEAAAPPAEAPPATPKAADATKERNEAAINDLLKMLDDIKKDEEQEAPASTRQSQSKQDPGAPPPLPPRDEPKAEGKTRPLPPTPNKAQPQTTANAEASAKQDEEKKAFKPPAGGVNILGGTGDELRAKLAKRNQN